MPRGPLSEAHKAAMQAGRVKAAAEKTADAERLKQEFRSWSKDNARLYLAWEDNCGKICEEPCDVCKAYRASNSAMPDMRGVEDAVDA